MNWSDFVPWERETPERAATIRFSGGKVPAANLSTGAIELMSPLKAGRCGYLVSRDRKMVAIVGSENGLARIPRGPAGMKGLSKAMLEAGMDFGQYLVTEVDSRFLIHPEGLDLGIEQTAEPRKDYSVLCTQLEEEIAEKDMLLSEQAILIDQLKSQIQMQIEHGKPMLTNLIDAADQKIEEQDSQEKPKRAKGQLSPEGLQRLREGCAKARAIRAQQRLEAKGESPGKTEAPAKESPKSEPKEIPNEKSEESKAVMAAVAEHGNRGLLTGATRRSLEEKEEAARKEQAVVQVAVRQPNWPFSFQPDFAVTLIRAAVAGKEHLEVITQHLIGNSRVDADRLLKAKENLIETIRGHKPEYREKHFDHLLNVWNQKYLADFAPPAMATKAKVKS